MGQYAEDIIDDNCDYQGDYSHEYNAQYKGKYKDEPWEANIRKVRKELAILIKRFKAEDRLNPVNNARKYINLKYGIGWRERGFCSNSDDQWKPLSEYKEPVNFKFN
jgi:hypothetical protein